MSSVPDPADDFPEPSDRRLLFTAICWVGVILIFVGILTVTYIPTRGDAVDARAIEERSSIRREVDSNQAQRISRYSWEDQNAGVVRLPINEALLELTLGELREANAEKLGGGAN